MTLFSGIAQTFTSHQDFLSDPSCYKMLSNPFYKSMTSKKLITSINSTIKMYQIQKEWIIWCIIIEYSNII